VNATAAKALFDDAVSKFDERLLASREWVVHSRQFPVLDLSFRSSARQELRLRLTCDDWNDTPPSVALQVPDGGALATLPTLRQGSSFFNAGPHPSAGRPFVCTPGVREYHVHPSHVTDHWSNYKTLESFTLGGIVTQIWRGWEKLWP
jgi:putative metal binding uncharacterized protein